MPVSSTRTTSPCSAAALAATSRSALSAAARLSSQGDGSEWIAIAGRRSCTSATRGACSAKNSRTTNSSVPRASERRADAAQWMCVMRSPGRYGRVPAISSPEPRREVRRRPNCTPRKRRRGTSGNGLGVAFIPRLREPVLRQALRPTPARAGAPARRTRRRCDGSPRHVSGRARRRARVRARDGGRSPARRASRRHRASRSAGRGGAPTRGLRARGRGCREPTRRPARSRVCASRARRRRSSA